jgi:hypothetical protein
LGWSDCTSEWLLVLGWSDCTKWVIAQQMLPTKSPSSR